MEKILENHLFLDFDFSICGLSLNVTEASGAGVEMERESQETVDFISDIEIRRQNRKFWQMTNNSQRVNK